MPFSTGLSIDVQELLAIARGFNSSIHVKKNKKKPLDEVASPWVDEIIARFPKELTHWKSINGEEIDDPMEIRMLALSLLLDTWLTDICLRKARDRSNPGLLALIEDYWAIQQDAHHFILRHILVEQDPAAVKAYSAAVKACAEKQKKRLRSK